MVVEAAIIPLVARLTVRDGAGAAFKAAVGEMVRSVARTEDGRVLLATSHRDRNYPAIYIVNEQYADAEALAAHDKTEHMAAFGGAIRELLDGRPEITRLAPLAELGT